MQTQAQVPLPFGAMISPGPFALLPEQLKDLRENGCKESLRRKSNPLQDHGTKNKREVYHQEEENSHQANQKREKLKNTPHLGLTHNVPVTN